MRYRFLMITAVIAFSTSAAIAQIRPAETAEATVSVEPVERQMLNSIEVKYQGGLFGYSKKEHGTIEFDDINLRLKFVGKDGKERFSVPYHSLVVIYPSQTKVQSGAGRAVGAIPFPGAGLGGSFIKKKKNYLIVSFDDPDVDARGTINFLVDTTEILMNSVYTIGEKAEMKARGDSYIRRKDF